MYFFIYANNDGNSVRTRFLNCLANINDKVLNYVMDGYYQSGDIYLHKYQINSAASDNETYD